MRFMQIESVLQTINRSEPAKKSVFCSPGYTVTGHAKLFSAGQLRVYRMQSC